MRTEDADGGVQGVLGDAVGSARAFAVRLALGLLLGALVAAALEGTFAVRLLTGDAGGVAGRLAGTAAGVQLPPLGSRGPGDPATRFATALLRQPGVRRVRVLDAAGTTLADLPATARAAQAVPARSGPALPGTAPAPGRPVVVRRGGEEVVTVALPAGAAPDGARWTVVLRTRPGWATTGQHAAARRLAVAAVVAALAAALAALGLVGRPLLSRHRRALRAAATDGVTGLGSHAAFTADLAACVDRATRGDGRLVLALLEVEGVSRSAARTSRREGDRLLARAAECVRQVCPAPAYLAGAGAFAVLLPGRDAEAAFAVLDDLRRAVAVAVPGASASVGLAALDRDRCPDAETLLIATQAALDEARDLGGNRVVGAADGMTGLRWLATKP